MSPLSIVLTRLTDSLTDSPDAVAIQTATVPMLPLRGRCRWRPVAVGAPSPGVSRAHAAVVRRAPSPLKRERAECSLPQVNQLLALR